MNLKQISANIRDGRILNVSMFTEEILVVKIKFLNMKAKIKYENPKF